MGRSKNSTPNICTTISGDQVTDFELVGGLRQQHSTSDESKAHDQTALGCTREKASLKDSPAPRPVRGTRYLFTRGSIYYFKRKIPRDAKDAFPEVSGQQIWRSLGTPLLHIARMRLAAEVAVFDEQVARFRRQAALAALEGMKQEEQTLPRRGKKVQSPSVCASGGNPEQVLGTSLTGVEDTPAKAATLGLDVGMLLNEVQRLFTGLERLLAGVQGSELHQQASAAPEASNAVIGGALKPQATVAGDKAPLPAQYPGQFNANTVSQASINTAASAAAQSALKASSASTQQQVAPVTMYLLFESWKLDQTRARTISCVESALNEFAKAVETLEVEKISRQHARAYRDILIEKGLSKSTIENRLGFLATLFRHGQRELIEHLHLNPFERIDVRACPTRQPKNRRAFEQRELSRILGSSLYKKGAIVKGQVCEAAYWLPLLGMFTGARLEEICQLYLTDVQCINGVHALRFANLEEDQKLKTESSFRRVPLHAEIINAGFLRHVEQMRALGHDRVFPSLSNQNANGTYSNAAGKWFARFLDSLGLRDIRLDFHSFRYTFKQQCTLCGISNEVRDALTGHWSSSGDSSRVYMRAEDRQYPFPALAQAIGTLSYGELDFSVLRVLGSV